jgi:DNA polymerase elongation subunit (family B)
VVAYTNAYLESDSSIVCLGRNEDGSLRTEKRRAEWVAYYRASEVGPDLLRTLRGTRYVRGLREDGEWLRVSYADRASREAMIRDPRSPMAGVVAYEGDVHAVARWAADEAIEIAKPRRAFVDIEGDSRVPFEDAVQGEARVLSIAIVDEAGKRMSRVLAEDLDHAEADLLGWFWASIEPDDQVVSWNGDGYDFPVLWARTKRLRIRTVPRRWVWIDQMEVFGKHNTARSGEENRSMALESVGLNVVGRGKLECPDWAAGVVAGRSMGAAAWDLWAAGGRHRKLLEDYNLQDTELLLEIDKKRPYLSIVDAVCRVCSIFPDSRSLGPVKQLDGVMLKLGRSRGVHFPTRFEEAVGPKFKGAGVVRPLLHGIGKNVHVYDFKSLYPTVMITWNMSPETRLEGAPAEGPIPDGACRSATGTCFSSREDGILIAALREMLQLRDRYKKLAKSLPAGTPAWEDAYALSSAYKVLANGFYGVLGNKWSRFYDLLIAEAITQTSKWLNEQTMAEAKRRGWRRVYADTDSAYLVGPTEEEMREFRDWCNREFYPRIARERGCRECHIMIAYEKEYARLIFSLARDGSPGAKMYVGRYEHSEGVRSTPDSKPEIKGLAYVRGDATRLASRLQGEVIDLLVGGLKIATCGPVPTDDVARYRAVIERHRRAILEGPLALADIEKSQALDRPLKDYAVRTRSDGGESRPAHVEIAEILKARGREVREGTRISYVVVDGSKSPMRVIPAEDYTGVEADRFYLWENLVYPATKALLEGAFPPVDERGRPNIDHDWERFLRARPKRDRHLFAGQLSMFGEPPPGPVEDTRVSSPKPEPASRWLHVDDGAEDSLIRLESMLRSHPGDEAVEVRVRGAGNAKFMVDFGSLLDDLSFRSLLVELDGSFAA